MSKKQIEQKLRNYSILKNSLRFITLVISIIALGIGIWALSVAYQSKSISEKAIEETKWLNNKQDNVIEMMMFKDLSKDKDNDKKNNN